MKLYMLTRPEFEAGLAKGRIKSASNAMSLPPHLAHLEGINLETLDQRRTHARVPLKEHVERRLLAIDFLLKNEEAVLSAPSPERFISAHARGCGKHPDRLRLWFITYITFGRNMWSLLPVFFRSGHWDRTEAVHEAGSLGRPSSSPSNRRARRLSPEVIAKIVDSYAAYSGPGRTLHSVYIEAMARYFGAVVERDPDGRRRLVGVDLPTSDQYRYYVHEHYGLANVQRTLYGEARYRRRFAAHKGKFTQGVGNLYEAVESDGYYCEDLPKGYVDGSALGAISVVRSIDTASGLRLGIGFSYGSESSEAYNAMHFCTAISKKKFCELFDIEIAEDDWPNEGLPTRYIHDRGPGIKAEPGAPRAPDALAIREMTPSGSGQSKALVESAQRRRVKLEGPATRVVSDLSPYHMVRREIRRLLAENQSANAAARMTPEMIRMGVFPNPLGIWKFLNDRARNDAKPVSFAEAVRRFLPGTVVQVTRDGAWLKEQRYGLEPFEEAGIIDKVVGKGVASFPGYIYPFCMRVIWIDVEGELFELRAVLAIRDDPDLLNRSYSDVVEEASILRVREVERRQHQEAAQIEQVAAFAAETGQSWYSSKRKPARSSTKARSSSDARDIRYLATGKK